ncbi:TolB family protein [Dictyobacter formicarum]|uniref:Dipeptidylpeptidase IV N-terminal domain-containing protein n=1 Tax=Dictyobacter formicarum TaxID=2778368 RepID=A0ABQ3VL61_9CHLR|nr:PD40 domain-containing protein [Dictyobacter formicarum]GHO85831.1 hypothetical protein KSZ_38370 [Dictyobacter formicarum]
MSELSAEQVVDIAIPGELQLSANGSRVAYVLQTGGKKDEHGVSALWVAPVDGSTPPRQFTNGESKDSSPQWSPDGRQLAFLSDRARRGTAQLYALPVDGGEARLLGNKESKQEVKQFAWSPGGGQIAFSSADEPSEEDERREKERDDAQVYGEKRSPLWLSTVSTPKVESPGDWPVARPTVSSNCSRCTISSR